VYSSSKTCSPLYIFLVTLSLLLFYRAQLVDLWVKQTDSEQSHKNVIKAYASSMHIEEEA